ncbi:MAG TPA: methyl-accepting chemotaxis protein, partial [Clostridia bacterium]
YSSTMKDLAQNINTVRTRLLSVQDGMIRISKGDTSRLEEAKKVGKRSENDKMVPALLGAMQAIQSLIEEVEILSKSAVDGKLKIRGDIGKFEGGYKEIIKGFNETLDSIVEPLDASIKVLENFAKNDYTLNMTGNYKGEFDTFAKAINGVQTRLLTVQRLCNEVANGDISSLDGLKKLGKRSENDQMAPSFAIMMETIQNLIIEAETLTKAALEGNLGFRGDANKFKGGYRTVIEGFNKTMDAVVEPVQEAAAVLEEMAKGNLKVSVKGNYKGDHAKIINALNHTISTLSLYVSEISTTLTEMSNGNLVVEISRDYIGEFEEIKNSLNNIIRSFNDVLNDINNAALQVASGSKQVSNSAQALSQGSTEQASSIEELTASMEEIASQTRQNATNANHANDLALSAKKDALKGNDQMKEMLKAMGDINESSANISKIIKVIDEIAFQTNILALNAAVEAARAGQHGKGFAVVAEEVRNLAARSADAAKETTALIEGSIMNVDGGTRIAKETAEALNKIVDGVTEAANLVGDIAIASNEQATGIAQVNQGIMQVSQVTQTNSATSQESAAASEELSSQAELLKEMVGKFRLKKTGFSHSVNIEGLDPEVLRIFENMSKNKKPAVTQETLFNAPREINLSDNKFGKY